MEKSKEAFLKLGILEKIAFIVGMTSSVIVIVLGILKLTGVWNGAVTIGEIFLGLIMITQTILQWKKNRGVAIFSLCVAIFVFGVAFVMLFLR